ncbi:hypothetical protein EVAR_98144_1 [Eumeta japonica]|uniref:Uncharacterized protein n=1 Tax=Eumeta variegata TaxID=151549 RepID=A0A4C1XR49_EUMVA|nr:hypothetical protein EVAR_98144_1 [Eumeta japonica]
MASTHLKPRSLSRSKSSEGLPAAGGRRPGPADNLITATLGPPSPRAHEITGGAEALITTARNLRLKERPFHIDKRIVRTSWRSARRPRPTIINIATPGRSANSVVRRRLLRRHAPYGTNKSDCARAPMAGSLFFVSTVKNYLIRDVGRYSGSDRSGVGHRTAPASRRPSPACARAGTDRSVTAPLRA